MIYNYRENSKFLQKVSDAMKLTKNTFQVTLVKYTPKRGQLDYCMAILH